MTLRAFAAGAALATPLVLAAAMLACDWWTQASETSSIVALVAVVVLPIGFAILARSRGSSELAARAIATPALVAPLAVGSAWTAAPSHLGIGIGGFGFFVRWLTKYPSWGGVNIEVLLGLLCVLACAFIPWLAAVLFLSRSLSYAARAALLALALVPYIPVFVRLDVQLVAAAFVMGRAQFQPLIIVLLLGPVLRHAAILSVAGMLFDTEGTARRSIKQA